MVWGATPSMDSTTPVTPALLPALGRQRDGMRQSDPPPYRPPPGRTNGGYGARPPPPQPAPRGGAADTARTRAHTHERDTRGLQEGQPDRARGTQRTAWNGVPASEGKGHPDGTARHTQRGTRGAGRGKRERHSTRYRPEPPEPAASAAHTQTGHCTRQGSSGAQRHAPTPRLGSLRASPRGSHWRQASSTGPAAPAPRATTH